MTRSTRRAETTRESRRLLLEAATALFAERGYRRTTFEDIAARSGVSRGSIPWHFGSKEGLLAAVVDDIVVHLAAVAGSLDPGTVDQVLDTLTAFTRAPSTGLFAKLMVEADDPESPLRETYAGLHDALRVQVRAWVARLPLPEGVAAEELGTVLLGAVIGIHQQWRVAPGAVDLDRTYATFAALLRSAGITAPAD
ncbi:helix-turn-helix domain-containing protein [Actinokineospora auranticolor]|uniref:TetR/AcrR family acrAB operon transcriptional repressor n=1 Tax=Actinokineospora auranticolor TaxID=155976 RepID=A0A2S6GK89_9PSEU|nr:TetR/AcrR family transcriptional regulator [Actinokineospora auranticolor]PPK65571.1 TetR/AcrR family acrAB operon transcriptional repressor [Actinokineospora auranticolor]